MPIDPKLERRLQRFDAQRRALLDEMDAMNPAHITAKPLAGKWSMLEILEHLVVAERAVLRGLPDSSQLSSRERTLEHRIRHAIVLLVLRWRVPVRIPSPAMAPLGHRDLSELRGMWDENQRWLRSLASATDRRALRRGVFEHPIAGPLTIEQVVRLGQMHLDTHSRQIRRLQRSLA